MRKKDYEINEKKNHSNNNNCTDNNILS